MEFCIYAGISVYLAKMYYKQYQKNKYGEIAQLLVREYGKKMDKSARYSKDGGGEIPKSWLATIKNYHA